VSREWVPNKQSLLILFGRSHDSRLTIHDSQYYKLAMATHNETGKKGEALAVDWLKRTGFMILHQNWRHSHYEIDIIALKENILHFIEVKTRRSYRFGFPEESVSMKKMNHLMQAAEEFMYQNPGWKRIQYDILSIILMNKKEPEFFLIEDVYL